MKSKPIIFIIFCFCFLISSTKAEVKLISNPKDIRFDTIPYMVYNPNFEKAYNELADMLDGKIPYSLKRAEYLVEYAHYDGKIDYAKFCHDIDSIVKVLNYFIDINNIRQYRTAPNFAIFEYFTKPSMMNGNRKFSYDFDDAIGEKDFSVYMASNLIKTHKGQCFSLPMLYKILCDELGSQSAFALAPMHMYIKHIGEDGKWVNIELTNGTFSSDEWIMESMHVTPEAKKNGVYMVALTDMENVALLINLLSNVYLHKYDSYDYFVERGVNKVLENFPNLCETLVLKHNLLRERGVTYLDLFGPDGSHFLDNDYEEYQRVSIRLAELGFYDYSLEDYYERMEEGRRYTQEHEASYE
ncbi:MAG: hypothetical protein HDS72_00325 [Bacteroidales bacterium]|nr:hypothetical protein [Bacteroidales bacterium]